MRIMPHDMPDTAWPRIARRHGIRYGTYHRRHTVYGWSKMDAATKPLKQGGSKKKDPNSTWQKLARHGLDRKTVNKHRKAHPDSAMTDDEIISEALRIRDEASPSIAAQARACNLNPDTVRRRMNNLGWSLQRALETPPMTGAQARAKRGNA